MIKILHSEVGRHLMAYNAGNKGGENNIIKDAPHRKDLDAENGTGNRCSEHRGKARAYSAYDKLLPVFLIETENTCTDI